MSVDQLLSPLDDTEEPKRFSPDLHAIQQRLEAIDPYRYAQTRNHLDGAVTQLSPYLTHGLLTVPQVAEFLHRRHRLAVQHKLLYELGWREYFQHVHAHLGDGILSDLHASPLPDMPLLQAVPEDVTTATTGLPVIDCAVQTLYATGYLHNHARLWLASYLVHLRKVHWRAGADWMYGLLLDGDVASNHLSWQWVSGTGSSKPYWFNAENVAKFAPEAWHSFGTLLDKDMETMGWMAQSKALFTQKDPHKVPTVAPRVTPAPPEDWAHRLGSPQGQGLAGRVVWLIHPWSLGEPPAGLPNDAVRVAVFEAHRHRTWPWRRARWQFVMDRMQAMGAQLWWATDADWTQALREAQAVHVQAHAWMPVSPDDSWQVHDAPRLWPHLPERAGSFSQWWNQVNRPGRSLGLMLAHPR